MYRACSVALEPDPIGGFVYTRCQPASGGIRDPFSIPAIIAFGLLCAHRVPAGMAAQQAPAKPYPAPPPPITNELDAFMEKS